MSPEAARLFFVSGVTFLVGAAGGAFAVRSLYGEETPEVSPTAAERDPGCAPCPQCPTCPPPVDCGELGVIPPEDAPTGGPPSEVGLVEPDRSGLPASALPLAMGAVKTAVEGCFAEETGMSGVVLLDLVATATAGGGFIQEATVTKATGEVESAELVECIRTAAEGARFEWSGTEGSLEFKLPVRVGR